MSSLFLNKIKYFWNQIGFVVVFNTKTSTPHPNPLPIGERGMTEERRII